MVIQVQDLLAENQNKVKDKTRRNRWIAASIIAFTASPLFILAAFIVQQVFASTGVKSKEITDILMGIAAALLYGSWFMSVMACYFWAKYKGLFRGLLLLGLLTFPGWLIMALLKDRRVIPPGGFEGDLYIEADNRGTRHDTVEKAFSYWSLRQRSIQKDPFIMYTFSGEKDAREALLDLACVRVAQDSGNLICILPLIFGYYRVDGAYQAIMGGQKLSCELWEAARESFRRHGGVPRSELEPFRGINDTTKESSLKTIQFVREVKTQGEQDALSLLIYRGPDAKTARLFLEQNPVTREYLRIIVETPEGTYGRDINGVLREQKMEGAVIREWGQ